MFAKLSPGYQASQIHGLLSVTKRFEELEFFERSRKILVTTNIMARAINVPEVRIVINFDLKYGPEGQSDIGSYMLRIGRAGRFGVSALAISLIESLQCFQSYKQIANKCGFNVKKIQY